MAIEDLGRGSGITRRLGPEPGVGTTIEHRLQTWFKQDRRGYTAVGRKVTMLLSLYLCARSKNHMIGGDSERARKLKSVVKSSDVTAAYAAHTLRSCRQRAGRRANIERTRVRSRAQVGHKQNRVTNDERTQDSAAPCSFSRCQALGLTMVSG